MSKQLVERGKAGSQTSDLRTNRKSNALTITPPGHMYIRILRSLFHLSGPCSGYNVFPDFRLLQRQLLMSLVMSSFTSSK